MSKKWDSKVVWITGASSGIGAALTENFINQGAIVALSARRVEKLEGLAAQLGKRAFVFPLDVQRKDTVFHVAEAIAKQFGRIDVVIANAGYGVVGSMEKLTEDMWRKLFDTNVFGVVWTAQAAIPYLKSSKGRLAIMSSVAGKLAFGNGSAYSASKFAVAGLANALYLELFKSGVSVTAIAPGFVESEIGMVDNLGQLKNLDKFNSKNSYFTWPAGKAAYHMSKAIYDRKREVVITGHGKFAAFLGSHLPNITYWGMAKTGSRTGS